MTSVLASVCLPIESPTFSRQRPACFSPTTAGTNFDENRFRRCSKWRSLRWRWRPAARWWRYWPAALPRRWTQGRAAAAEVVCWLARWVAEADNQWRVLRRRSESPSDFFASLSLRGFSSSALASCDTCGSVFDVDGRRCDCRALPVWRTVSLCERHSCTRSGRLWTTNSDVTAPAWRWPPPT